MGCNTDNVPMSIQLREVYDQTLYTAIHNIIINKGHTIIIWRDSGHQSRSTRNDNYHNK